MTNEGRAKEYFDLFEQYRGFRPSAEVQHGADGTSRIKIEGFAEVIIGSGGGWAMPDVKTYPEGTAYEPAVRLGWPSGRGMASKIACIFADYYARQRGPGEKPPYFLLSPADCLRDVKNTNAVETGRQLQAPEVEMTTKKPKAVAGKIHLKWVVSAICAPVKQKLVIKGLGFTRLNQVIERPDNGAIRGMVAKVPHLVEILK
jgi:large subunit ribosomal protein L30